MQKSLCDACNSAAIYSIYTLPSIPAFQNMFFATRGEALKAPAANVELSGCPSCGLVFNSAFNNSLMEYGPAYQNAQDFSPVFQSHLEDVADIILRTVPKGGSMIEVGSGKGHFLELLKKRGLLIKGFDPAYEGSSPDIEKRYFEPSAIKGKNPDAILMRHTLEHIEKPYAFLKAMVQGLSPDIKLFIEIPRFEWIHENKAFWDVFHEHCNYFTEDFFQHIFGGKATITRVFTEQYMLVSARVGDLVSTITSGTAPRYADVYSEEVQRYTALLQQGANHYVWGAGAKGVAFANILDKDAARVKAVIDINTQKQGWFLPLTGHACVAPSSIAWNTLNADDTLWIMNGNYEKEILGSLPKLTCKVITLA